MRQESVKLSCGLTFVWCPVSFVAAAGETENREKRRKRGKRGKRRHGCVPGRKKHGSGRITQTVNRNEVNERGSEIFRREREGDNQKTSDSPHKKERVSKIV